MSDIDSLLGRVAQGELPEIVALVGDEPLQIDRCIQALKAASVADLAEFNATTMIGASDLEGSHIAAEANTLPMMADKRFVLVTHADKLSKDCLKTLDAYAASPSASTCLVLRGSKLDGRSPLTKRLKKMGRLLQARPLRGRALDRFVVDEFRRIGHSCNDRLAHQIAESDPDNLAAIVDSITRISLFVGGNQEIDQAALDACLTGYRHDTIWALVDAVSEKRSAQAMRALRTLLADRESPIALLGMIVRQYGLIAKTKSALAAGETPERAATSAGVPPFKAQAFARVAKRISDRQLRQAIDLLAETDLALKGGRNAADVTLTQAVLQLSA